MSTEAFAGINQISNVDINDPTFRIRLLLDNVFDISSIEREIDQCTSIINNSENNTERFYAHLVRAKHLMSKDFTAATEDVIKAKTLINGIKSNSEDKIILRLLEAKAYIHVKNFDRVMDILDAIDLLILANQDVSLSIVAKDWRANTLTKIDREYLAYTINKECFIELKKIKSIEIQKVLQAQLTSTKASLLTLKSINDTTYIQQTIDALSEAIDLARQENLRGIEYNAYGNLAYMYYLQGKFSEALELGKKGLRHSQEVAYKSNEGVLHSLLAQTYFELADYDSAAIHMNKTNEMLSHFTYYPLVRNHLNFCKELYLVTGETEEGFDQLYNQFLKLAEYQRNQYNKNFDLQFAKEQLESTQQNLAELESENKMSLRIATLLLVILLISGISLYLNHRSNKKIKSQKDELAQLNQDLEKEVVKRTKRILEQNDKIKDFAYHNSHHTRAPVSRLLGLIDLFEYNDGKTDDKEIVEMIKQQTEEVDQVIIRMNRILDEQPAD